MQLRSYYTHVAVGMKIPFSTVAGTPPYTYSVLPDGAGGSIDANGLYTAPQTIGVDVIQSEDSLGEKVTTEVCIGTPLHLVCDIVSKFLNLGSDQVYIMNQKISPPDDERLYVCISVLTGRAFGSSNKPKPGAGLDEELSVNVFAPLDITIYSRTIEALLRKEEVVMALNSNYARSQMELNSFVVASVPGPIVPLNYPDGAAINFMFNISANIQYMATKVRPTPYFDDFQGSAIETNP